MKRRSGCWGLSRLAGLLVPMVLVCVSVASVSCRMTPEGVVSVSSDVSDPKMTKFSQESQDTLVLVFSEDVTLSNLEVRKGSKDNLGERVLSESQLEVRVTGSSSLVAADGGEAAAKESQGMEAQILFKDTSELYVGESYILSGVAHDQDGNSLLFQIPFRGYNSKVAGVVLSEVRTEASNTAKANAKIEFVELYVHTSGDLAGISLYNAGDDKQGEYEFPSAEVTAGEYIVVHFRTMEEHAAGCIDEKGNDLNVSTAPDSCDDVRDFWVPGTAARLGKSDVILLRERSGGKIVDALLYAESDIKDSTQKKLVDAAQLAVKAGAWQGSDGVATWVVSDGLTTTRTLSRQNIAVIADGEKAERPVLVGSSTDWMVVKGATPGKANSTERYVKK